MIPLYIYTVCYCGIVLAAMAAAFRMGRRVGKKQGLTIARASERYRRQSWALPIVEVWGTVPERGWISYDSKRVAVRFGPKEAA